MLRSPHRQAGTKPKETIEDRSTSSSSSSRQHGSFRLTGMDAGAGAWTAAPRGCSVWGGTRVLRTSKRAASETTTRHEEADASSRRAACSSPELPSVFAEDQSEDKQRHKSSCLSDGPRCRKARARRPIFQTPRRLKRQHPTPLAVVARRVPHYTGIGKEQTAAGERWNWQKLARSVERVARTCATRDDERTVTVRISVPSASRPRITGRSDFLQDSRTRG
jgi:hypothetical protein